MKIKHKSVLEIVSGVAFVAACSGKLAVDDRANQVVSDGGNGTGGAGGMAGSAGGNVDRDASAGGLGPGGAGGFAASPGIGGDGGDRPGTGGSRTGGYVGVGGAGGSAGCYSGPEEAAGASGSGGKGVNGSVPPTCPLDADGFATANLDDICGGSIEWVNASPYPCPASSADLVKGLDCSTVTTEHAGFTKTVGCGFETIEFQSYEMRAAYDLEHEYAASYDTSTGKLSGLVIKEPGQFGPCMSYAYKAGTLPGACPSAVTYKCNRIPQGNSTDAAYAGCRAPDEPGCEQCCNSDPIPDSCTVWTAGNGATVYNTGVGQQHACTCGCTPCAQCKLEDERNIRLVVPHPECNCSLPPMGDPCASWCNNFVPYKNNICPGL